MRGEVVMEWDDFKPQASAGLKLPEVSLVRRKGPSRDDASFTVPGVVDGCRDRALHLAD